VLQSLRERVVLVAAPSHRLARMGEVRMRDVATLAQPLLLMRWWLELPTPLARLAEQTQSRVDVPMDTGRAMVLRGSGAGFFPWMQVAELIQSGMLCEVEVMDLVPLVRESALVRRSSAVAPGAAAMALVETLTRRAREVGIAV
jgi:DNA-binding transcriptional LysR family regulator